MEKQEWRLERNLAFYW